MPADGSGNRADEAAPPTLSLVRSRPVLVRADGKVMRMMLAGPLWTLVILLGMIAAAAQVPVRAHAKAGPALPALCFSKTTYCLWAKDAGEAPAAKRLVTDADTDSGAFHARRC